VSIENMYLLHDSLVLLDPTIGNGDTRNNRRNSGSGVDIFTPPSQTLKGRKIKPSPSSQKLTNQDSEDEDKDPFNGDAESFDEYAESDKRNGDKGRGKL
jgi:hypothetical protein